MTKRQTNVYGQPEQFFHQGKAKSWSIYNLKIGHRGGGGDKEKQTDDAISKYNKGHFFGAQAVMNPVIK